MATKVRITQARVPRDERVVAFYGANASREFLEPRDSFIVAAPETAMFFVAESDGEIVGASAVRGVMSGRYSEMCGALVRKEFGRIRPHSIHALFTFARALYADLTESAIPFAAPLRDDDATERLVRMGLTHDHHLELRAHMQQLHEVYDPGQKRAYLFANDGFLKRARKVVVDLFDGRDEFYRRDETTGERRGVEIVFDPPFLQPFVPFEL